MKEALLGRTPQELKEIAQKYGLPAFAGAQIARWLYVSRVSSIEEMTNLSKAGREALAQDYEVGLLRPVESFTSVDGTRKYLFPTSVEGKYVETVMIPEYSGGVQDEPSRATVCVSSQVGCKMNCAFCMTGRGGFHGHLSTAEILSQFIAIDESSILTNAVFMGMGEPMDNWPNLKRALDVITADWGFAWSPKRVTVSTVGVIPTLKEFLEGSRCHLAVSMHNPFPRERTSLMPVEKAYSIKDVVELIRRYDFTGQRRISFEYTMFAGVNDSKQHSDAIVHLLRGLECRVNLIRFHSIPDSPLKTSSPEVMEAFKTRLCNAGIVTTVRASRGEDIMAACGLLAGRGLEKK